MSARRNPPSFVLVDKTDGTVVYTKRATGVGTEAINKCVWAGRAKAQKTGRTYFVFLDIGGLKVGQKINVPAAYAMGITEEIGPQGSAMPSGRRCCSSPDVRPSGQGMRCFNCQRWEAENYLKNPVRVRKNIFTFNNPYGSIEGADKDAARELELYIENDADLYRQQYTPIIKNLMLKRKKGIFNPQLAAKLFLYLVEAGAKKYCREFGGVWHKMFSMPTRQLVANHFVFGFSAEADLGNYDHLLVKPTQRGLKAAVARRGASNEFEMDMGMYEKGYRYKLIPKSRAFDPLYAKTLIDAAAIMREYKNDTFDTVDLRAPSSAHENPRHYYSKGVRDAVNAAVKRHFEFFGERISGGAIAKMLKRTDNLIIAHELTPFNAAHQALIEHLRGKRGGAQSAYENPTYRARFFAPDMKSHETRIRARGINEALKKAHAHAEKLPKAFTAPRSSVEVERDDVRPNIFTFNNPRKLNAMEQAAAAVGLYVTTWAPGDGKTRYRFHRGGPADYHDGTGIYTAVGRADAMKFIQSYGLGRSRKNPLTRAEAGQELKFAREAMQRMAGAQRAGVSGAADFGYAQGIAGVVGRRGTRAAARAAERVTRHVRYNPSPIDPPGLAELDSRMNELMRKMDAMKKAKTDGGPEYMILLKEAQAVSKERIKLIGLGGKVLPNPLLQTVLLANPGSVKTFNEMQGVGKAKYVVNYHDGVKVHRDGSPFFDIAIFSSQAKKDRFVRELQSRGFTRGPLRNPPISAQWDRMTRRQREALLEIVGYDRDYSGGMTMSSWATLSPSAKRKLEAQWLDTTSSGGTTKRRRAPVTVNPLTRSESAHILKKARRDVRTAEVFRPGHTRSEKSGQAYARAAVVKTYGPSSARRVATKIQGRAERAAGTVISNPGVRFPKPGTKMTVAQAMELARRIGDRELIKQCEAAAKLQTKANRGSKCVIWKTLPIGSKNRIDMVTAFAHYGDSPEDMYKPPKGSKKGQHMYRHKWGEGTGRQKSVPVLAAPGGKAIIKVMGSGQSVGDWMRG